MYGNQYLLSEGHVAVLVDIRLDLGCFQAWVGDEHHKHKKLNDLRDPLRLLLGRRP